MSSCLFTDSGVSQGRCGPSRLVNLPCSVSTLSLKAWFKMTTRISFIPCALQPAWRRKGHIQGHCLVITHVSSPRASLARSRPCGPAQFQGTREGVLLQAALYPAQCWHPVTEEGGERRDYGDASWSGPQQPWEVMAATDIPSLRAYCILGAHLFATLCGRCHVLPCPFIHEEPRHRSE